VASVDDEAPPQTVGYSNAYQGGYGVTARCVDADFGTLVAPTYMRLELNKSAGQRQQTGYAQL
jgi:hypothetical protein